VSPSAGAAAGLDIEVRAARMKNYKLQLEKRRGDDPENRISRQLDW